MPVCNVCHNHCSLIDGQTGFCLARTCKAGAIISSNYGQITSIALDPIEKKPLARFFPGSLIVSVGSYGCNLRCPFCQNHSISYGIGRDIQTEYVSPEELVGIALSYTDKGNIGIAFTYNEPLIGYEYVRDTAKLAHENGLKTVLVSNGCATKEILSEILPYIDAMNIDCAGVQRL